MNCYMTFKTFLKKVKIYLTHFNDFYFENLTYSFCPKGNLYIFHKQTLLRLIHYSCLPLFYTELSSNFFNNFSVFNMYDEHLLKIKKKKDEEHYYSEETYFFVLLSGVISKLGKKTFTDVLSVLLMSKMFLETTRSLIEQNLMELDQFYLANGHILTHMTDIEICNTKNLNCIIISSFVIEEGEFQKYNVGFKSSYCQVITVKKEKYQIELNEVQASYNLRCKTEKWKATCSDYFHMTTFQAQKLVNSRLNIAKFRSAEENELNSHYGVFGVRTAGYNNTGRELLDYDDGSEES